MNIIEKTMRAVALAIAGCFIAVSSVAAQDGYFFRQPRVSLSLKVGAAAPAASDDLFDFFTTELTLERSDFEAALFGADLGIQIDPQVDAVLSLSFSRSHKRSESAEWEHQNDTPIEQETTLMRTPLTAGVRFYPWARGRSLGEHAWVPTRSVTPYVGGGAGIMWYKLEQEGEFVDESTDPENPDIFRDYFVSDDIAFTAQAFGGVDLWVASRFGINLEGRYSWAKADLNNAFSDWDRIDLRGWQLTTGLTVRF